MKEHRPRVALVTGSSRGLGRATALELAARGHTVAIHYVASAGPAEAVAEEVRAAGGHAATFGADVADAGACAGLLTEVVGELGGIDVLVNNAGITRDALALRMKHDDWQGVLDTNLSSAFHLSKGALRGMLRTGWGRIVNVSSVVGIMGNVGQANYVAAKAGLIGLTKALAREYGAKGVTVNAVAPGFIDSDMTAGLPEALRTAYLAQIPLARFGEPAEVAKAIAFLASDDAAYVTGQTLVVDGGLVMP
ncbi:3-oxoacyl-[acyl-carrier-protein] reductase [soil metagenome]|nr:3-oxoacyl-[acyl-carrier-protein] reductase [Trueperaceae bacterium]